MGKQGTERGSLGGCQDLHFTSVRRDAYPGAMSSGKTWVHPEKCIWKSAASRGIPPRERMSSPERKAKTRGSGLSTEGPTSGGPFMQEPMSAGIRRGGQGGRGDQESMGSESQEEDTFA